MVPLALDITIPGPRADQHHLDGHASFRGRFGGGTAPWRAAAKQREAAWPHQCDGIDILLPHPNQEPLGRLSARHVQRILTGAVPGDLPVEQVDRFSFIGNLKTARELGITIPQSVLQRADKVIE